MTSHGHTDVTAPDMTEEACPIRDVLDRVGDRWTVQVLQELGQGPRRFNELHRSVPGISRRMLTRTLRNLERDGLVVRTVHPTTPPTVEYAGTVLARDLRAPLEALAGWAAMHCDTIRDARRSYDRAAMHPVP